ncbi:hypothetical protein CsSME_00031959 [Camellia sinensis var. sinensis]
MSLVNYMSAPMNPNPPIRETLEHVYEEQIMNVPDTGFRQRNPLSDCGGVDYKYMNSKNAASDNIERNSEGPSVTMKAGVGDCVENKYPQFSLKNVMTPKISSLIKHVKEKARRSWELPDYEYPGVVGHAKHASHVRIGIMDIFDDVVDVDEDTTLKKIWARFKINH